MDNGNTLLDLVDDTSDLFGGQNDSNGQLFNWADEFLRENEMDISGCVATESGNLATNTPSNVLLTSSNYAAISSLPAQTVSVATPYLQASSVHDTEHQSTVMPTLLGQTVVNSLQNNQGQSGLTNQIVQQSNHQYILKTANGNQIQLTQSQLQQHLLQQQTNTQTLQQISTPSSSSTSTNMNRSATPNTGSLPFGLNSSQFQSASPGPNVNIVHLTGQHQQQPQQISQQAQQTQQLQIAPGTFLQIPGGLQNMGNSGLFQGHQTILGAHQGSLMNGQNTVIQNPNVVNVNVATHQAVLCSTPQQPQQQQRFPQNPFNIQGTLIQTAEGKSILIPSQNLSQPINIQPWSMQQPVGQNQTQNPVGNIQLAQSQTTGGQDSSQNQGVQQIVLNSQGQQILVQRAPTPGSQPIIVRTTVGQPGLIQIQQRTSQNSGQSLQAISNTGTNQQLKIVQQAAQNQTGIPMINIGGQNISLQQLSGQLGNNMQSLQLIQQLQQQQQQQSTLASQGQSFQLGQVTLQQLPPSSQGQLPIQPQAVLNKTSSHSRSSTPGHISHGQMVLGGEQITLQENSSSGAIQLSGNDPMHQQSQSNFQSHNHVPMIIQTSQESTENAKNAQAQILLQQIQRSMKLSHSKDSRTPSPALSSYNSPLMLFKQENTDKKQFSQSVTHSQLGLKTSKLNEPLSTTVVSSSQAVPSIKLRMVKQETMDKTAFSNPTHSNPIHFPFQTSSIKKEPDLIETLVKQEVPYSAVTTAVYSSVTSTISHSSPMSLFTFGSSGSINSSSKLQMPSPSYADSSVVNKPDSSVLQTSSLGGFSSPVNEGKPSATVQTIHLPPDLQQQFQRVQLEMKKAQMATNLTNEQKQAKLIQLQGFQKKILLKGRVLATTRAEPHQIQQGLAALSQTSLGLNSSGLPQNVSTAISSNVVVQQSPVLLGNHSSPVQGNTTVKHLLKSVSSADQSRNPSTNVHLLSSKTTSLGAAGISFMNSATNSSNSLSGLLNTPSSNSTTPAVTTNQSSMILHTVEASTAAPSVAPIVQTELLGGQTTTLAQSDESSTIQDVAVPTQIKIANKVLTLSLTRAQRDKVQSYLDKMTPEQQQQYLQTQQGVLQRIQKQQEMNAQVRAQILAQKKQQALLANQKQVDGVSTVASTKVPDSQIIKTEVKSIPVLNPAVQVTKSSTESLGVSRVGISRGQKRNFMDIPKGTLINQQIKQDQNHALNVDTKRPFKSRGDACRRLLRYHVFQSYGPTLEEFTKFDGTLNDVAVELLQKKDKMFDRFRVLLLHETMRCEPSSELVMLQRMQNQDLRKIIEEEKELVNSDPDSFVPMPSKFLKKEMTPSKIKKEGIKDEDNDSSDIENMDSTLVKMELTDSDIDMKKKMKKLVIKTDGENYRSSFKRKSLESSHSSMADSPNSSNESLSVDVTLENTQSNTDDEDTNKFGNDKFQSIHDEAEKAALLISSAEESQDSQTEMGGTYRGFDMKNSTHLSNIAPETNVIHSTNSCELTSESMYYEEGQSVLKTSRLSVGSYSSLSGMSSVEKTDLYGLHHSPVSNASSDTDVVMEGNPVKKQNFDKYDTYQPITECLTDSEENSHYSADNSTGPNPIVIDDDHHMKKGNWKRSMGSNREEDVSSSDPESDQDVKAQMESAINSILSLGQQTGVVDSQSIYSYNQSSKELNTASHADLGYTRTGNFTINVNGIDKESDPSQMDPYVVESEGGNASDLELAVNSILM